MTRAIRFSAKARQDLQRIWYDTREKWGEAQAQEYTMAIQATLRMIDERPTFARDASRIRPGLLRYPAGSHMIFLRISQTAIEVVRILHNRMDYQRHFAAND